MTQRQPTARSILSLLLLTACWLGCAPAMATGQTAADLFNQNVVHDIRLFINERDLAELRERYLENTYYPADLHWGSIRVRNVGVRSRGSGSRNQEKLGLRIDFNRYVTGQRLVGLTSIVLDNFLQDPSMLRDRTAMAFFALMGQPAPRISLARLYVNNQLEGIYGVVEEINSNFLERTVGAGGYLFEYHHLGPYYFEDLGDDLGAYAALFEPRTHEQDPAATLYVPIRELVRDGGDPVAWRQHVEQFVDLKQFLTMTAIERFLSEFDGLTGYEGLNNFYLYRLPNATRHVFLPWDRDNAFRPDAGTVFQGLSENVLLNQAMSFPDLRAHYAAELERAAVIAETDGWLANEFTRGGVLLAPHVPLDSRKPYTDADHAAAVAALAAFAQQRAPQVRSELAAARAAGRLGRTR